MYWQKKFTQPEVPDEREQIILAIREEHKDYGYRRLWAQMRNLGHKINRKAVQRIVQKLGLQVHSFTHRTRKYSSYRGSVGTVADNLLNRRFKTSIPHQKITTDTSEFKYWLQGEDGKSVAHKLYFDPYMDLFNNEIVSFHIGKTPSAMGIQSALEEAIRVTSDCPYRRTFHSDQGWASDEVVHETAQGGANLSEHVTQRELSGQQRDGELLWTLKARDLLWARLP